MRHSREASFATALVMAIGFASGTDAQSIKITETAERQGNSEFVAVQVCACTERVIA